jgi:hypothetical protein
MMMLAGPWGKYEELLSLAEKGTAPLSFDGRKPVAIERKTKHVARLLYEYPPGRERLEIAYFSRRTGKIGKIPFPEYQYIED